MKDLGSHRSWWLWVHLWICLSRECRASIHRQWTKWNTNFSCSTSLEGNPSSNLIKSSRKFSFLKQFLKLFEGGGPSYSVAFNKIHCIFYFLPCYSFTHLGLRKRVLYFALWWESINQSWKCSSASVLDWFMKCFKVHFLPRLCLTFILIKISVQFSSVQLLSRVQLFATPWIAACQASLSITISQSSLKLTSIKLVMPSHPLLSPSPPAPNPSQHQSLFQWVNSSHEVAKVLEFQLQHHSFQRTPRADLL